MKVMEWCGRECTRNDCEANGWATWRRVCRGLQNRVNVMIRWAMARRNAMNEEKSIGSRRPRCWFVGFDAEEWPGCSDPDAELAAGPLNQTWEIEWMLRWRAAEDRRMTTGCVGFSSELDEEIRESWMKKLESLDSPVFSLSNGGCEPQESENQKFIGKP